MLDGARLNPAQQQGVEALKGPVLILAGAGSGKTRVLTYRIAHLIESGSAFPGEIFAVTFTNKAAKEMRERVAKILGSHGMPLNEIWITTFHSAGAKILREHGYRLGLHSGFSIFDDSDQLSLIKDCMNRLEISDKVISPKSIMYRINQLKNDAIDPREYKPVAYSFVDQKMGPVFKEYEAALLRHNAVDFGDLLFKTYRLFADHPDLLEKYQDAYPYLLVDEYQDTNAVQYKFLKLFSEKYRNLCVVGDEDQSIYKWRGADIRNILDFEKDFPESKVIKLEENYRSSAHIIRAANRVISFNKQRKEKTLFTSNPDGDQVEVHMLESDFEEGRFVIKQIKKILDSGYGLEEIAIFYRTHAQSRLFEDNLRAERLPYKIFGGLKFYDRAEVKDALAYLRLFVNPKDDLSLFRIINVPTRGIGKTTIDALKAISHREDLSGLETLGLVVKDEILTTLNAGAKRKLHAFLELYERLLIKSTEFSPAEFYAFLLEETGYLKALEREGDIESVSRLENLKELSGALIDFEQRSPEGSLAGFLEEVALLSDADRMEAGESFVTMMTLHSAKGLEYPVVFLVGLEEGLFPSIRMEDAGNDSENIEEERRLCYVGMTRARKKLILSLARMRRVFGVTQVRRASRFIDELPVGEVVIQDHAPRASVYKPWQQRAAAQEFGDDDWAPPGASKSSFDEYFGDPADGAGDADDPLGVGKLVNHPDYGTGTVVRREGQREGLKVSVRFERAGVKKFVARFAPLTPA